MALEPVAVDRSKSVGVIAGVVLQGKGQVAEGVGMSRINLERLLKAGQPAVKLSLAHEGDAQPITGIREMGIEVNCLAIAVNRRRDATGIFQSIAQVITGGRVPRSEP